MDLRKGLEQGTYGKENFIIVKKTWISNQKNLKGKRKMGNERKKLKITKDIGISYDFESNVATIEKNRIIKDNKNER